MTPSPSSPSVSAWKDPFRTPSADELLEQLPEAGAALKAFRDNSKAAHKPSERVEWRGEPWRWAITLEIAIESGRPSDADSISVYLVTDPERPRISIPVPTSVASRAINKQASRAFRDAFDQCKQVGRVLWTEWDVRTDGLADEVGALLALIVAGDA